MNNSKTISYESSYRCFMAQFSIVKNEMLLQSIFLDIIAAIILCGFAYRFYRGIEISHPVYAVLFSNIVFSIVSSFISFIGALYLYIGQSCEILWILTLYNNTNIFIVSIVSCTTISVLRYHLLITSKIENKVDDLNLPRIKNISLVVNWTIIIVFFTLRVILHIPFAHYASYSYHYSYLGHIILPSLLIPFIVTTFAVYYKMDVNLKQTLVSEGKFQCELGKRKNSGKSPFVELRLLNANIRCIKYQINVT